MKFLKRTLFALAVAGLMGAGGAQAASVSSTLFNGFQQLSDNSAESLINGPCAAGAACSATTLDLGDRLRGIFTIETLEQAGSPTRFLGGASANNELAGIFDITVVGKVSLGPAGFAFVFAPTATFAAEWGAPAGTAVVMFEDATPEYERINPNCTVTGPGGDCEGLISDGSLLFALGFGATGKEFWSAFAVTDDIGLIGAVPAPGNGGTFNLALDMLVNNSSRTFLGVPCGVGSGAVVAADGLEVCGSGSLLGNGGVGTPYDTFDNVDFTVNVVPEPSSTLLVGLGLLAAGALSRRQRRQG